MGVRAPRRMTESMLEALDSHARSWSQEPGDLGGGSLRGEGPAIVREGWGFNGSRPFESVFFSVFFRRVSRGSPGAVFYVFCLVFWFSGGLFVSVFRKSTVFFEKVQTPVFCIQYSVLA